MLFTAHHTRPLAGIFGLWERIPGVIRVLDPSCPLIRLTSRYSDCWRRPTIVWDEDPVGEERGEGRARLDRCSKCDHHNVAQTNRNGGRAPQIRPQAGFPRSVDCSKKPRFFTRHIVSRPGLNSVRWWQLLLTGTEQFLEDTGIVKRQCATALLPDHF